MTGKAEPALDVRAAPEGEGGAAGEPVVVVEGLSKVYKLYRGAWPRLLEALTFYRKRFHEPHWALRDIGFTVARGETLGIIGSNGAGKSTLLKILTGTTQPSAGRFRVRGRVSSLLELGAGFQMEFSGRDNIYMNGSILGFTRKEIHALYRRIVDFSELGPYIEHPLRTYSSGMIVRLGFSIAINVDPDVLILDEVFAVGDVHFQKKCIDRLQEFRRQRKTILFVSHSIPQVREICSRVLWLREGRQEMLGDPLVVTQEYENYERERTRRLRDQYEDTMFRHLGKAKGPRLREVALRRPGTTEPVDRVRHREPLEVHIRYETFAPEQEIHLVVCLLRNDGLLISVASTKHEGLRVPHTGYAVCRLPAQPLLAGAYTVSVYIFDDSGLLIYDQMIDAASFRVDPTDWDLGIIRTEHTWEFPPPVSS